MPINLIVIDVVLRYLDIHVTVIHTCNVIRFTLDDNFRIHISRQGSDYINAISLPVSAYLSTKWFFNHIKLSAILLQSCRISMKILAIDIGPIVDFSRAFNKTLLT